MLLPADVYVCLYLTTRDEDPPGFERMAADLGIGIGTAHRSTGRLMASGLLLRSRRVQRRALLDVLLHAVRHVYYVEPGGVTRGIRTAEAAPPLATVITPTDLPPVWPDASGDTRGYAIEPLHKSVPDVVKRDPSLYAMLALVDALRIGQARVRSLAAAELRDRLSS